MRVGVDDAGRATALHWIVPIADNTLRDRVTRLLLATKYVPAECDGLACADTYDLRG